MRVSDIITAYAAGHTREETTFLAMKLLGMDGGPGSGNFGHKGRPGKRGGSGKGEGSGKSAKPDYSPEIIKAAEGAENHVEFWMNLPQSEQSKFKSTEELKAYFDKLKNDVPEAFEQPEYKPTNGTKANMPKSIKVPKELPKIKIENNPDDTATAHAGKRGEISVNLANFDPDNIDGVIAHEAAHQLSNNDPELQAAIISNYGDVLGRYNQKKNHFEGIYGEYNPEEAFATGLANYRNYPEEMKKKYPDAYEWFDELAKNQPEVMEYLNGTVEKTKQKLFSSMHNGTNLAEGASSYDPNVRVGPPVDVTEEYKRTAKPGQGKIVEAPGYNIADSPKGELERETAEWIVATFGGTVTMNKQSGGRNGKKNPEYTWRGRLWELKEPDVASKNSIKNNLRDGLHQIHTNPGGVLIDITKCGASFELAEEGITERARQSAHFPVDVIIIKRGTDYRVMRFTPEQ